MCVDDYQFRHYSAIRSKECRRFIFINQDDIEKAFFVNISQFQELGEVALCKIIYHLSSKGLPIFGRSFYWPKYNISVQPGDYCKVPFWTLADKEIIFHSIIIAKKQSQVKCYSGFNEQSLMQEQTTQKKEETDTGSLGSGTCGHCEFDQMKDQQCIVRKSSSTQSSHDHHDDSRQSTKFEQPSTKRIKQPERLIVQVIIALKKWRKLYESKTLNLTKAATIIGISKKSLDDYYLVIRVGQILGFDFSSHIHNKMGDLRAFIRGFDHKVTGKLSKEVKCFDLVSNFKVEEILENGSQKMMESQQLLDDN